MGGLLFSEEKGRRVDVEVRSKVAEGLGGKKGVREDGTAKNYLINNKKDTMHTYLKRALINSFSVDHRLLSVQPTLKSLFP